jgi:DnaJ-class molecular chaperone
MEYKEAKEVIGKFKEAITKLEWDASSYYSTKERCLKLEEKNKALTIEIQDLKKFKRYYNLLQSASNIEICSQCDGDGGFVYDMGECGCEGEECVNCNGSGIVDKVKTND